MPLLNGLAESVPLDAVALFPDDPVQLVLVLDQAAYGYSGPIPIFFTSVKATPIARFDFSAENPRL